MQSADGIGELHRPAVQTPEAGTSYAMGWFVGPVNDIPAIHHQGETFNFHANVVLVPQSRRVVVLINAENSLDLFVVGRIQVGLDLQAPPQASGRRVSPDLVAS